MVDVVAWVLISLAAMFFFVHRRVLAQLWFGYEDPRPIALLRIATGLLVVVWLVDLLPLVDYLFTSEGVVSGAQARGQWARLGPWSPLFAYDHPTTVHAYVWLLGAAALCLAVGLATPITKWITWALFIGLVARNGMFTAGEQIFASTLFYLCLAQCGRAYGIDAWLHHRRGSGPALRAIPSWPRNLMLLQLLAIFCANGLAKYGESWARGDATYFVFNHPHFRPADLLDVSAAIGPLPFRLATHITHSFELLFFVAIVGIVARRLRGHDELLPRGRARLIARVLAVAIGINIVVLATLHLEGASQRSLSYAASCLIAVLIAAGPWVVVAIRRLPAAVRNALLGPRVWVALWLLFTLQLTFVLRLGWFCALTTCLAVVMWEGDRTRFPADAPPPVPVRWGRARRIAIGSLSAFHVLAVLALTLPSSQPRSPWRRAIERPLYQWIRQTTFNQTWRMFAPATPVGGFDLEVVLIDGEGQRHPLGSGLVDRSVATTRWAAYKRGKLRRRLAHPKGAHRHRGWHADYLCRRFGNTVVGPATIELHSVRTPIPSPARLAKTGADASRQWVKEEQRDTLLLERTCPPPSATP